MHYGVIRIINEELLWLSVSGRYTELGPASWVTADKIVGYAHARANSGLLLKMDEKQLSARINAPRCPQNRSVKLSAVLIPPAQAEMSDEQYREFGRQLRKFRESLKSAPAPSPS